MKFSHLAIGTAAFVLAVAGSSIASEVSIPNTFTSGSKAVAAEVNANFAALETAVNDNNDQANQNWLADGVATAPSTNSSVTLTTTDTVVRSVSINTPFDGQAIFSFQSWFNCTSAAACVARCTVNPGGTSLDTTRFALTSVAPSQYQTLSVHGALPTVEGETLTLNAVCDVFSGSGSLGDPALTVVYSAKDISVVPQ